MNLAMPISIFSMCAVMIGAMALASEKSAAIAAIEAQEEISHKEAQFERGVAECVLMYRDFYKIRGYDFTVEQKCVDIMTGKKVF